MADVRDGVGVYLAVYLLVVQKWSPAQIGFVIALPGFLSILAQSPVGSFIDRTTKKRLLLALASFVVALACLTVIYLPTFYPIAASQVLMGLIGTIFQPCVSAISLGLVGPKLMRQRVGRNESFNHAGNLAAAVVALAIGYFVSYEGIFYFSLVQCAALIGSTLLIREKDIDHDVARAAAVHNQKVGSFFHDVKALLAEKGVAAFILALTFWNLANGPMLPLVGQKLGITDAANSAVYLSVCIILAQAVMIGMAPYAAKKARIARKPLFLLSFLLIPVRALLFAFVDNKYALMSFQLIDGLGAGIYGVLSIVMMADLGHGTGRFNLLQGVTYAAMGVGGAVSMLIAGYLLQYFNYQVTFLAFAGVGIAGALFFWLGVPETGPAKLRLARLKPTA